MKIILVTGGARSGKSGYAEELASRLSAEAAPGGARASSSGVTYIATAQVRDGEMARRVERHRSDRPSGWETLEAPLAVAAALGRARFPVVILDCLTLLLSNHIEDGLDEAEVEARSRQAVTELLSAASHREGELIVVTNELGMGVVPAHPLGRWFRDAQGRANQALARRAHRVVFLVSGVPWVLKDG